MYVQIVSFIGKLHKIYEFNINNSIKTMKASFTTKYNNINTTYFLTITGNENDKSWNYLKEKYMYNVQNAEFVPKIVQNKIVLYCLVSLKNIIKIDSMFTKFEEKIDSIKPQQTITPQINKNIEKVGDLTLDSNSISNDLINAVLEIDNKVPEKVLDEENNENLEEFIN